MIYPAVHIRFERTIRDLQTNSYHFHTFPIGSIRSFHEDALEMKVSPTHFTRTHGQCFNVQLPRLDDIIAPFDLTFDFQENVSLFLHSPGLWLKHLKGPLSVKQGDTTTVKVDLERFDLLDHNGKKCYDYNRSNYDDCSIRAMDKMMLRGFGCTSPFGFDADNICQKHSSMSIVDKLIRIETSNYESLDCEHPCDYYQFKSQVTKDPGGKKGITRVKFIFSTEVKVFKSRYSFSFFSLLTEIG